MKDKFFLLLARLYELIYSVVLNATYKFYAIKTTKNLDDISDNDKRKIKDYWKNLTGKSISTKEYKWYKSKGVQIKPGIIPNSVYHSKIEPYYNNIHMLKGFSDKNYIDLIIGKEYAPDTIIHCINGEILDGNYLPLRIDDRDMNAPSEMICKPSMDSCGGRGIQFIKGKDFSKEKLVSLVNQYKGNFVLQSIIKQHEFFSQFNSDSVNTIRIISFLDKGKVHILSRQYVMTSTL